MNLVTDPELLKQLNSEGSTIGKPVTDPVLLSQLNGNQPEQQQESPWYQKVADTEQSIGNAVAPMLKPFSTAMQGYDQSQQGSPTQMLQQVPGLLNRGANYLGDKVTESLAGGTISQPNSIFGKTAKLAAPMFSGKPIQTSPMLAATVGTAVKMAPDVLMSAVNPEEGAVSKLGGSEYAQNKALSAMGTPKRLLKGPRLVEKAQGHAQTLLDAGLVKPFRGAQGMADELSNLESSSGQKIGEILDNLGEKGKVFDPQQAINEINQLRPISKSTGQILRGGAYDKINGKIDDAVATIQAHLPQVPGGGTMARPLSFQEANDLKGILQGLANYASNKDVTLLDKVIAGKFRESLDNSLEQAAGQIGDPNLSNEFQQAKKLYGASQFAKDPIYNKLSSELTNKKISLTDWILGSASLATGNPLTAAAEVGIKKGLEKFGPGTQAYISNKLSKTPSLMGASNKAYGATRFFQGDGTKTLDKVKTREFVAQAKRENPGLTGEELKKKVAELASKENFTW